MGDPRQHFVFWHTSKATGKTADSFQTQIEFGGILRLAEQEKRPDE